MEFDKKIEDLINNLSDEEKALIVLSFLKNQGKNLYQQPSNLLFKDFKPKYKWLEVMYDCDDEDMGKIFPKIVKYDKIVKQFGDRKVVSFIDYKDTKTTSVRLSKCLS